MDEILPWWPDWLPTALQSGDSAIAIVGGVIVAGVFAVRYGRKGWRRTDTHKRRAQAQVLDQLALGRPVATVETVLGPPHLLTRQPKESGDSVEERVYRLPGAWVTLQAPDGAIATYSITITDEDLYYDTGLATLGIVPVRLGRDTFADARPSDDESMQIYARLRTFVRFYDYGYTATGGQYLWLAFNDAGAGKFGDGGGYATGAYSGSYGGDGGPFGTAPDCSAITVNTLTVAADGNRNHMVDRGVHGPHPDIIRRG